MNDIRYDAKTTVSKELAKMSKNNIERIFHGSFPGADTRGKIETGKASRKEKKTDERQKKRET